MHANTAGPRADHGKRNAGTAFCAGKQHYFGATRGSNIWLDQLTVGGVGICRAYNLGSAPRSKGKNGAGQNSLVGRPLILHAPYLQVIRFRRPRSPPLFRAGLDTALHRMTGFFDPSATFHLRASADDDWPKNGGRLGWAKTDISSRTF